jgi:hypothetical protein
MTMPKTHLALGVLILLCRQIPVSNAASDPPEPIAMNGHFTNDNGKVSVDISGIACQPEVAGKRLCLAIDDQGRFAQVAVLDTQTRALTPGDRIKLIGKKASSATLGAPPPNADCHDKGKFKDLDGEAVAYAAPYFYVMGSHGCSRGPGEFSLSSFITVRLRLDPSGRPLDKTGAAVPDGADSTSVVETTYRLSDALRKAPGIGPYFATPLRGSARHGLNIEGVAVLDGVLYAGARAPSVDGKAFIIGVRVDDLFAAGHAPLLSGPQLITPALGKGVGIRDLAPLPDGRLVILAGPTKEDPHTPFQVFLTTASPATDPSVTSLAILDDIITQDANGHRRRAKAEAILPIDSPPGRLHALLLFDGLPSGGAAEYRMDLPPIQ